MRRRRFRSSEFEKSSIPEYFFGFLWEDGHTFSNGLLSSRCGVSARSSARERDGRAARGTAAAVVGERFLSIQSRLE